MFTPRAAWLWAVVTIAALAMPGLLWQAADQASISLQGELPTSLIARVSLGSAFWVTLTVLGLMLSSALQQLQVRAFQAAAVFATLLLALGVVLVSGACNDLSLVKEYANRADGFVGVVGRHLQIVLLALAGTLAIGLPLGWAAHAHAKAGRVLLPMLNIIQTIPSI
eukprot:gene42089-66292_t